MYPGTSFNWIDNSAIQVEEATIADNTPLFLAAASFDKGPEDMRVVAGDEYRKLYGTPSFEKHGQAAIQITNIINNGGAVLLKRVVADDATLANVILVATVTSNVTATPVPAGTTVEGAKTLNEILGKDTSEDTDATTRYTTTTKSTVKWTAVSVAGIQKDSAVLEQAEHLMVIGKPEAGEADANGVITITNSSDFPMFVIVDNGRGTSNKTVKFTPDYNSSKTLSNFFYSVSILEGTTIVDSQTAAIDPNAILDGANYGFNEFTTEQVKFLQVPNVYTNYIKALSAASGLSIKKLYGSDVIFLKTDRRTKMAGIELTEDSIDLDSAYGVPLTNGTDGAFGSKPIESEEYDTQLINFFDGTFTDEIFDLDEHRVCAIFDANYSMRVKEAIAKLVTFREDCMFFRDLGVEVNSYDGVVDIINKFDTNNKFIADYFTTYQIYDPDNGKRIRVTMMYDFAAVMVDHFANRAAYPAAGIANGMILPSAIKGTLNFVPRITPVVNQKSLLENLRVNYAVYHEDQCVVQTLYTSQEALTQLSYVNNVLAIEEVAREIRRVCPRQRYTFASGNDFTEYANVVNGSIVNFMSNFAELSFEYVSDAVKASQKIFYGILRFRFNNWAQSEIFDLYALPTEDVTSTTQQDLDVIAGN